MFRLTKGKKTRRYRKINPLNRQEFVERIQQAGKIDILLVTLQKLEKYVQSSQGTNFAKMFLKSHHNDLLQDIEKEVNKNFSDCWGKLDEDGFFIINLVCYSGTAIERTTKQCQVIRVVFLAIIVVFLAWILYFHNLESFFIFLFVGLWFVVHVVIYILLYHEVFMELVESFNKLKATMTEASHKIAKSILESLELALEYKNEQQEIEQDSELANTLLLLMSEIGSYEFKIKGKQILEEEGKVLQIGILDCKINNIRREEGVDQYINKLKNSGMNDNMSIIIAAFTDAIRHLDNRLQAPNNLFETIFNMRHQRRTLTRLVSLFDVHKMDAVTRSDVLKTIARSFKMSGNRNIHTGGGNYNETINTGGGDYVQGDYINMNQDLKQAASQIQDLVDRLKKNGMTNEQAQDLVAKDLATKASQNPQIKEKLMNWAKSLGDATVKDFAVETIKLAAQQLTGIPFP